MPDIRESKLQDQNQRKILTRGGRMLSLLLFTVVGFQPDDIESRFLKYRMSLARGHLEISGENHFPEFGIIQKKWMKRIWYAPGYYRCDHVPVDVTPAHRTIYCENCERKDCYVYIDEQFLGPNAQSYPVVVQSMKLPAGAARLGETELKFDPRIIGATTSSFLTYHAWKLNEIFGRNDRTTPVWEKTGWNGKEAWLMFYQLKHGPNMRWTFVPELGDSLVKIELVHESVYQVVECDPRQFGSKRIWFPAKVVGERYDGGKLLERYTLEITKATFNEPIPAETFKLAGMDIPADTWVDLSIPGAIGRHKWDGEKIVQVKEDFSKLHPDLPPASAAGPSWMRAVPVSLAVLGTAAIGIYFYRRRSLAA